MKFFGKFHEVKFPEWLSILAQNCRRLAMEQIM
uniref:Uncharacterized protein n=1 Tax=Rhizophora mucronata TaxID=61149 RepID=A0A2P2N5M0_RHIMU